MFGNRYLYLYIYIKRKFDSSIQNFYSKKVESAKNKSAYFARELHEAMAGLGTKDDDLIRLLVTRSEVNKLYFKSFNSHQFLI